MIQIGEAVSYIKARENPLSADVGILWGREKLWLFDVGNGPETFREIQELVRGKEPGRMQAAGAQGADQGFGNVAVVLSHFHPDHIGNLDRMPGVGELYVGEHTRRYTKRGTVVDGDLFLEDGCRIHLFPLPSSHAKGSLGMEIDEQYAFLGDGIYSTRKNGSIAYNVQLLREEIRTLKALKASKFLISHREPMLVERQQVIARLEEIYALRKKDRPYIELPSA